MSLYLSRLANPHVTDSPDAACIRVTLRQSGQCHDGHALYEAVAADGVVLAHPNCSPSIGVELTSEGRRRLEVACGLAAATFGVRD